MYSRSVSEEKTVQEAYERSRRVEDGWCGRRGPACRTPTPNTSQAHRHHTSPASGGNSAAWAGVCPAPPNGRRIGARAFKFAFACLRSDISFARTCPIRVDAFRYALCRFRIRRSCLGPIFRQLLRHLATSTSAGPKLPVHICFSKPTANDTTENFHPNRVNRFHEHPIHTGMAPSQFERHAAASPRVDCRWCRHHRSPSPHLDVLAALRGSGRDRRAGALDGAPRRPDPSTAAGPSPSLKTYTASPVELADDDPRP